MISKQSTSVQPQIPRARSNHNAKVPTQRNPLLSPHIPITQVLPVQRKRRRATSIGCQTQLSKPSQLLRRRRRSRRWQPDIQLRNLSAGNATAVHDGRSGSRNSGVEIAGATRCFSTGGRAGGCGRRDREAGIGEVGVRCIRH